MQEKCVAITVAIIGMCIFCGFVSADPTISYTPNPPQLGNACFYTISNMPAGAQPMSYLYEFRSNGGTCTSSWMTMSTTDSAYVIEDMPGTYDVRCTIQYQDGMCNVVTVVPQTSVTVPDPSDSVINNKPSCLGVPTLATSVAPDAQGQNGASGVTVEFAIKAGDMIVGEGLNSNFTVQEKLTNKRILGVAADDTDWVPTGPDWRLYMSETLIEDFKYVGNSPDGPFGVAAVGDPFYTLTQSLRIQVNDYCGNLKTYPIGSHSFTLTKVSATQWQLTEN